MLVHQLCVPTLTLATGCCVELCGMPARLANHFAAVPRLEEILPARQPVAVPAPIQHHFLFMFHVLMVLQC
jgi:hypothetical protein